MQDPLDVIRTLSYGNKEKKYYSLPALAEKEYGSGIARLPISIRVVLESLMRNCDGEVVTEEDVCRLAKWQASDPSEAEIPFVVSRIVLQDFTGVPLLVDLAAMRDVVASLGQDPGVIEPLVPVDLVVDHSVQVDKAGSSDAFEENIRLEFERNRERYEFLKWGQQAFETFNVIPPSIGIVHQVNLEYLAKVVFDSSADDQQILYPDTLVGTDSHTTMINGLGVVGWGVGGIEAEAGMLGQPVYFQTPEVIGVNLTGALREGVTATDLTLTITEILRAEKVVGKFVEFFGNGAEALSLADRATIANMAPEYGATMGFFPVDDSTIDYLRLTGRTDDHLELVQRYLQAQNLYGMPKDGEIDYSKKLTIDLDSISPCVAGPKKPQDRISIDRLDSSFSALLGQSVPEGGFALSEEDKENSFEFATNGSAETISHGSVLIAAITSCTNTSNPSVMIAAGLVARKAVEKGLSIPPYVKTSLAPGSRVVTEYLEAADLQSSFDQLGFQLVGYGCTTCIGNSGPLDQSIETGIKENALVAASVLSGNRNFEARVHGAIKANFLMSPPLVVAYALAGRVDLDLTKDPIGKDAEGQDVFLQDLWPSQAEIEQCMTETLKPKMFVEKYSNLADANPAWQEVSAPTGKTFSWNGESTYVQSPPFFEKFGTEAGSIFPLAGMKALAILGDSVTTDHISPAGSIPADGPAGQFLQAKGVRPRDFNSFGSRRGNDRIMTRGTFANVRIKNLLADGREGGYTKLSSDEEVLPIHDASLKYAESKTPLIVFGGIDYGMGSSRDWAAKGTSLLGVKAVVAKSFERIHRSNLIGMGVLPLEFKSGEDAQSLALDGTETFDLAGLNNDLEPGMELLLGIERSNGERTEVSLLIRIDTGIEVEYYRNGGILPYVLRQIIANPA